MADDAAPILSTKRPAVSPEGRRLLSFDDLKTLMRIGVVQEGEKSELVEGELFVMPSEGDLHVDYVVFLAHALRSALPQELMVAERGVLNRPPDTQLSPDVAIWPLGKRARDMTPANVLLVVEVSDSTARSDKRFKVPLYARMGVAELWIMDVQARQLIVHRGATQSGWREVRTLDAGEAVAPLCAPDARITVPSL